VGDRLENKLKKKYPVETIFICMINKVLDYGIHDITERIKPAMPGNVRVPLNSARQTLEQASARYSVIKKAQSVLIRVALAPEKKMEGKIAALMALVLGLASFAFADPVSRRIGADLTNLCFPPNVRAIRPANRLRLAQAFRTYGTVYRPCHKCRSRPCSKKPPPTPKTH